MKRLLVASIIAFSLPACAGSSRADTAEPQTALPDIAELIEAHDAAWNAHDPDRLAGLFAADGTLVTPTGNRLEGRDALRESFASPSPTKQTTSQTTIVGVQELGNGLVLIDAQQKLSGPGVERIGTDTARAVLVARPVDGQWEIVSARPYLPARP